MHLRCELNGHEEDVRGLCICPLGLVTSSRDTKIKIWSEKSNTEYEEIKTLIGHESYVGPIKWLEAKVLAQYPDGALISGSRDKSIIIWDIENSIPNKRLEGHKYQVTCLDILKNGIIASGSIDGTIKLWSGQECINTLKGHESSVLCLSVIKDNYILSGSGDKTMRLWKDGECCNIFHGHMDSIRAMVEVPEKGIITASHDMTLGFWNYEGKRLVTFIGHSAIIYCCDFSLNTNLVVSGSEDNTCRIWNLDGTCNHVIGHPGNVWDVKFLENGDVVTGCSDSVARIFSEDEGRKADESIIKEFEEIYEARQKELLSSKKGILPPGLKIEDISILQNPGKKNGENVIVNEGGGAVVYSWNDAEFKWEKIGDVLGNEAGEMSSGSKFHNGQQWDYVFDVDFADGAPLKKLCMNQGENAYEVAQRFLLEEKLPLDYHEQVVQFILQNTRVLDPSLNADPLTGASSYIPPGFTPNKTVNNNSLTFPNDVTGGGADPLTGTSSKLKTLAFSPKKTFVFFDVVKSIAPIFNQIKKFNDELNDDPDLSQIALNDEEINVWLEHLLKEMLKATKKEKPQFSEYERNMIDKFMFYPDDKIFPILDIIRVISLDNTSIALIKKKHLNDLSSEDPGLLGKFILKANERNTNHQVILQMLVNFFNSFELREWLKVNYNTIFEIFGMSYQVKSKTIRLAYATLILNYAIDIFVKGTMEMNIFKADLLSHCHSILSHINQEDFEPLFRTIVAIGTLIYDDTNAKTAARDLGLRPLISKFKNLNNAPTKLGQAIKDFETILE